MQTYRIKNGYDIPLSNPAAKEMLSANQPSQIALQPAEFTGIKSRLNVKIGDEVKAGSPLFHAKRNEEITFCSPVAGKVSAINYGPRRVVESLVITPSGSDAVEHEKYSSAQISSLNRADLVKTLLKGGVWPFIRQRPFNSVANPEITPSSIFVNAMDSAPLAADDEFACEGKANEYEAGIRALKVLSENRLHVCAGSPNSSFLNIDDINRHVFTGKHPAGLVSTHISRIDPILDHEKKVWYITARDTILLGSFLLTGRFQAERTIAIAGPGAKRCGYVKTTIGASVDELLRDVMGDGENRVISGNALTGRNVSGGFLGFYDNLLTVIPEGRERHFMGWLTPGLTKHNTGRTHVSSFIPGAKLKFNTNMNGEPRALARTGEYYERFVALDVIPDALAKAILAEDFEQMDALGLLECDPEDFALCSYACPSKFEFTTVIASGLAMMEKELG